MPEEKLEQPTEQVEETKTTYSQEEVEKMIQQEADRRVTQALKKQSEKQAEKLREAEKLAQMTAEQKNAYEVEQLRKQYETGLRDLALERNKNAASKVLADKGLDLSLIDLVVADEADVMNERIQILDKAFKKSVKTEVERRLASKSPVSTLDQNKTYTKEDIGKLTYEQAVQLFKEQPDLFEN